MSKQKTQSPLSHFFSMKFIEAIISEIYHDSVWAVVYILKPMCKDAALQCKHTINPCWHDSPWHAWNFLICDFMHHIFAAAHVSALPFATDEDTLTSNQRQTLSPFV
jgi:hypothetical protein